MAYASVDHTGSCRGTADCHHVWTVLPFLGQAQRIYRGLIKADLLQLVFIDRALQVGITTVPIILLFGKRAPLDATYIPALLLAGSNKSCELPVDHLYAVLGLFEPRLQRGMAEAGLIDSSRPYWQIVILFNVWYLSTSGISLLLPYASQPDKHSSIPSCCADWSTPFGEVKEVGMHSSYHASLAVGARSERTNPAVEVILSSDSIRLSGFCVDGIHEVVSPTPNWEQWNLN